MNTIYDAERTYTAEEMRECYFEARRTGMMGLVFLLQRSRTSRSRYVRENAILHVIDPKRFPIWQLARSAGVSKRRLQQEVRRLRNFAEIVQDTAQIDYFRN